MLNKIDAMAKFSLFKENKNCKKVHKKDYTYAENNFFFMYLHINIDIFSISQNKLNFRRVLQNNVFYFIGKNFYLNRKRDVVCKTYDLFGFLPKHADNCNVPRFILLKK